MKHLVLGHFPHLPRQKFTSPATGFSAGHTCFSLIKTLLLDHVSSQIRADVYL
jgi:hypothetical protein